MGAITNPRKLRALEIFSMAAIVALFFVLPKFGIVAEMVGGSAILCVYTFGFSEIMRDAKGRLTPAILLTAFVVLLALACIGLKLAGQLSN